jgi:hypothetical protein
MDIEFFFDHRIIGNLGPDTFDYLINNEVVRLFTLPNHERTSVHNRNNWLYDLDEHPIDPHSPPETPPIYEYLDDHISIDEYDPEIPPNYYNLDEPELPSYIENLTIILPSVEEVSVHEQELEHAEPNVVAKSSDPPVSSLFSLYFVA